MFPFSFLPDAKEYVVPSANDVRNECTSFECFTILSETVGVTMKYMLV